MLADEELFFSSCCKGMFIQVSLYFVENIYLKNSLVHVRFLGSRSSAAARECLPRSIRSLFSCLAPVWQSSSSRQRDLKKNR